VRLVDEPDEIRYVIRRAVTDAGREIVFRDAPEKAGVNNLLEIYELLTQQDRRAIVEHFAGKGYTVLKQEVAELVIEALRPIREGYGRSLRRCLDHARLAPLTRSAHRSPHCRSGRCASR
jgi:tryptophanyl-tRNA synthetase